MGGQLGGLKITTAGKSRTFQLDRRRIFTSLRRPKLLKCPVPLLAAAPDEVESQKNEDQPRTRSRHP
jgi:hypothetical protein